MTSLTKHEFRIQNMCAYIKEKEKKNIGKKILFFPNDTFQLSEFFLSDLAENSRFSFFFFKFYLFITEMSGKEIFLPLQTSVYLIRHSIINSESSFQKALLQ